MTIAQDIAALKQEAIDRQTLRILTLDIETSPNLAYIWSLWKENIPLDRLITPSEVLCVAAKWYGEDEILFYSNFKDGHGGMICAVWDLLNEADVVVHYNGNAFDLKHLNREFILNGLTPPSPYKSIDLLTVCRGMFKFVSNKLDHVAEQLGFGGKVKHSGFSLWTRCMAGDPEAWKEFEEYNKHDVVITEKVYTRVRPWIKSHPTIAILEYESELVCPRCSGTDLVESGTIKVQLFEYPAYVCTSCGGWVKGKEGTRIANLRSA